MNNATKDPILINPERARLLGLESSIVLDEILHKYCVDDFKMINKIAYINVNATQLSKKESRINFLTASKIQKAVKDLEKKGIIVRRLNKGKKSKDFTIEAANLSVLCAIGEHYFDLLVEHDTEDHVGFVINRPLLDLSLCTVPDNRNVQLIQEGEPQFCLSNQHVVTHLKSVASHYKLPNKTEQDTEQEKKKPDTPEPVGIKNDDVMDSAGLEGVETNDGVMEVVVKKQPDGESIPTPIPPSGVVDQKALAITEGPADKVIRKPEENKDGVREEARNDYVKYCKYMQVGKTLKKETEDWKANDFVIYLYCGIAKRQRTNLTFPNFAKDGAVMKGLFAKYGKQKLKDLIYHLVMYRDAIAQEQFIKGLEVSISTLSTDWIIDKINNFIADKQAAENEHRVIKETKQAEERAHEGDSSNRNELLGALRNKYNNGGQSE